MNVEIKLAQSEYDRKIIKDLYLSFLRHLDQYDFEILPTKENANFIVESYLWPAAKAGDPILIAWENSQPVGVIFWAQNKEMPKTRHKLALEYGIYVDPLYRKKGIGKKLREKAKQIIKDKGVKQVVGTVSNKNKASLISQEKAGFVTRGYWQELIL